jgi:dGTPase
MTEDLSGRTVPGLQTIAEREALLLAPYAMHSVDTAGRHREEAEHPYRGPYQRDRDRILHSAAFRRLSGKMQVFTGEMGDYHRTRLTHTYEVASIARTIGRTLRLNEDLIEALSLLHDIGHPPFGHAGEDALDGCLADDGGFCHNDHALTIVQELEQRYHGFPGLNLSREVLEGQATRVDKEAPGLKPLLEVQVVDTADSIAYDAHDTDDALKLGILTLEQLASRPLIRRIVDRVRQRFDGLRGEMLRKTVVHELIDYQVSDVLDRAGSMLAESGPQSAAAARHCDLVIIPSTELDEEKRDLEAFLYERVYRHPKLLQIRQRAQMRLTKMFSVLVQEPQRLPNKFQRRSDQIGLRRGVGEYLAGMTDRFCDQQYNRYFHASQG